MKKFTKVIACACIQISTVCGLWAAPKKEGSISRIKPKETVTLNVLAPGATQEGIQTGAFAQAALKKLNIKINIIKEAGENSADSYDIILWENAEDKYAQACAQNELLDWEQNKLLEKWGPYLKTNFKQALLKNKFYDSPDKRMHGFAQGVGKNGELKPWVYTWNLRKSVYEEIGQTDFDSLYDMSDVFLKMKEAAPFDSEGGENFAVYVFNSDEGNMAVYPLSLVNAYYGYDAFDFGFYNSDNGEFYDCLTADGPYLYCLKFLNKLNQAQLLTANEKSRNNVFWNIFAAQNDSADMMTVCPNKAQPAAFCQGAYGNGAVWTIGSGTENAELCMAFLNWLALPDGYELLCDASCGLGALTWSKDAFETVDAALFGDGIEPRKIYESLYVKGKGPEGVSKADELAKLIRTQSWAAIFAKDDEEYEKIISKMTEDARTFDYDKWSEYSRDQAKKRFAAEKLLK